MSRSRWKGFFVDKSLLKKTHGVKKSIWSRSSSITEFFLNKKIQIYNGRVFKTLYVKKEHIGFKFGEFSFTRKYTKKLISKKDKLKKNLKQ